MSDALEKRIKKHIIGKPHPQQNSRTPLGTAKSNLPQNSLKRGKSSP